MTTITEMLILWAGNGIVTATVVVLSDRLFKRHVEKVFDKVEKSIKALGKTTKS